MRVFVDTSALVAVLDIADHRHAQASTAFEWLRRTAELVTTNYVAVEALAVARRRLGREAVPVLVDVIYPLMTTLWVAPVVHSAAVEAYRSGLRTASVVDEASFAVMRAEGIDMAFAYDDDFERQGFSRAAAPTRQIHETPAQYGDNVASELVSVAEIASRANRSINTVQSWRRRHHDFPAPVAQLAAGPIWNWPQVAVWVETRDRKSRPEQRSSEVNT